MTVTKYFLYFIVCVYMYHCLIQPYGCKIRINDYYNWWVGDNQEI